MGLLRAFSKNKFTISMAGTKKSSKEILYFLCLIIFLAFFLTCLLFPYKTILANRYLKFGYFHTILNEFFKLLFPLIQSSAPLVFSGFAGWKLISVLKMDKTGEIRKLRSIIIGVSILFIASGIFISSVISKSRNVPIRSSYSVLLVLGVILSGLILLIYSLKSSLAKKIITSASLIIFILVIISFFSFSEKKNASGPNVLFIVVDTLRSDHTSIEDPGKRTTGYLKNTLLPDSIYFRKGYSNSPWTLPSISSMLTSKYPSQLGIRNLISKIGEREFTLPELMREEGYITGGVISHILLNENYGFAQGFDYFSDKNISGEYGNHIAISSPGVTEDALKFIQSQKDRKFFLFLHYFDPHYIYLDHEKREDYSGKFTSKDISFLRNQIRKKEFSTKDTDYLKHCYDTEIRYTDFYVGRVIDELKKKGIYDNTIIVFTSDHGEEFVERGWLGHSTTLYNEQTAVPIMIKPADMEHLRLRKFEETPVSNIDLLPTLITMAKLKRMPGITGTDLFGADPSDHTFFGEVSQKEFGSDIELVSVVWKNWKMIKDLKNNLFELYNISRDREEKLNLTGSDPVIYISTKLKIKLQRWLKKVRKPGPSGKKRSSLSDSEKRKLKTLGYIN